jgi:hypothetical protein|tara:strand:+ start:1187 stop:1309 length:123 start_codon:yes stop_codon:yes gene_type:complete
MKKPLTMDEAMEHRGISRKTFLICLLQFPWWRERFKSEFP